MATIIKARKTETTVWFERFFESRNNPGSGYGFACDADGNIDESQLTPVKQESLATARDETRYADRGVERHVHRYTSPAEIRCHCGHVVTLHGFTNTCDCGRDYNMSGDMLAPRSQWGEETGEHWSECM